jgi:hypothetical protein
VSELLDTDFDASEHYFAHDLLIGIAEEECNPSIPTSWPLFGVARRCCNLCVSLRLRGRAAPLTARHP